MEKYYPIGTIVKLHDSNITIMITSLLPLCNNNGQIGYFDYAACMYPYGLTGKDSLFFNEEDIETVIFTGYENDDHLKFKEQIDKQLQKVEYPRHTLNKYKADDSDKSRSEV